MPARAGSSPRLPSGSQRSALLSDGIACHASGQHGGQERALMRESSRLLLGRFDAKHGLLTRQRCFSRSHTVRQLVGEIATFRDDALFSLCVHLPGELGTYAPCCQHCGSPASHEPRKEFSPLTLYVLLTFLTKGKGSAQMCLFRCKSSSQLEYMVGPHRTPEKRVINSSRSRLLVPRNRRFGRESGQSAPHFTAPLTGSLCVYPRTE